MHLCLWSSFSILIIIFFFFDAFWAPLKGKHLFLSSSHISAKAKSNRDGFALELRMEVEQSCGI